MRISGRKFLVMAAAAVLLGLPALTGRARAIPLLLPFIIAHCDTENGPVIKAAKKALETGNIDPALVWIQEKDEPELKAAFEKTLAVRKLNPQARDLADHYFYETLVRIHRAGEGAPYTGIKPAGTEEPAIAAADRAVETGNAEELAQEMSKAAADGVRGRFKTLAEKKKHKDESVEAGREYVEAYVTFIHYVERLHKDAAGGAAAGPGEPAGDHEDR